MDGRISTDRMCPRYKYEWSLLCLLRNRKALKNIQVMVTAPLPPTKVRKLDINFPACQTMRHRRLNSSTGRPAATCCRVSTAHKMGWEGIVGDGKQCQNRKDIFRQHSSSKSSTLHDLLIPLIEASILACHFQISFLSTIKQRDIRIYGNRDMDQHGTAHQGLDKIPYWDQRERA